MFLKNLFSWFCLLFLSCSGAGYGIKGEDWTITGKSVKFPDSRFLVAIGRGETQEIADDNARGELSKLFKVHVTHETESKEGYTEQSSSNTGKIIEQSFDAQQITKSVAQTTLEGVIIANRAEKSGNYFSLAVLEKDKTANSLKLKLKEVDSEIGKLKISLDSLSEPVEKARVLGFIIKKLFIRDDIALKIRVLASSSPGAASVNLYEAEDSLYKLFQNDIRIGVVIDGEKGKDIAGVLKEEFGKRGIPLASAPPYDILIRGNYHASEISRPPDGWFWVAYSLNLSATSVKDSSIISTVSVMNQVGHKSTAQAYDRAVYILKSENLIKFIDDFLDSFFGIKQK